MGNGSCICRNLGSNNEMESNLFSNNKEIGSTTVPSNQNKVNLNNNLEENIIPEQNNEPNNNDKKEQSNKNITSHRLYNNISDSVVYEDNSKSVIDSKRRIFNFSSSASNY